VSPFRWLDASEELPRRRPMRMTRPRDELVNHEGECLTHPASTTLGSQWRDRAGLSPASSSPEAFAGYQPSTGHGPAFMRTRGPWLSEGGVSYSCANAAAGETEAARPAGQHRRDPGKTQAEADEQEELGDGHADQHRGLLTEQSLDPGDAVPDSPAALRPPPATPPSSKASPPRRRRTADASRPRARSSAVSRASLQHGQPQRVTDPDQGDQHRDGQQAQHDDQHRRERLRDGVPLHVRRHQ
jgi:hypothetical protein